MSPVEKLGARFLCGGKETSRIFMRPSVIEIVAFVTAGKMAIVISLDALSLACDDCVFVTRVQSMRNVLSARRTFVEFVSEVEQRTRTVVAHAARLLSPLSIS